MIKKLVCMILLICILLTALFWDRVIGTVMLSTLNSYCRYQFGHELEMAGFYHHRGFWVFEKPALHHKGAHLCADRILFGLEIKPLQRTVDLELTVENSQVDLMERMTNLEEAIFDLISKTIPYWMFKIHSSFVMKEGKITWPKSEADFSFIAVSEPERTQGVFALFMDGKKESSNFFELKVNKEKKQPLLTDFFFRGVECCKMAHIYQALGHPCKGWEIQSGLIDGKVHYTSPENHRAYIYGEALLQGLSFCNPRLEIAGSIQETVVKLDTQIGKITPRIIGEISLDEEASIVISKKGFPFWELRNFKGGISFLPDDEIQVGFHGQGCFEGNDFGVNIQGSASIFDDTRAAIELACYVSNPSKEDAELDITMRQQDATYNSAEFRLKNFGKEDFNLIQSALSSYLPTFRNIQMKGGRIDASGVAYFQDLKLLEIDIDRVLGENLWFDFEAFDIAVKIGKGTGDVNVNLAVADPLEILDGNFALQDGDLELMGFNGNIWKFRNLSTVLALRKGVLQQSDMRGKFAGLDGNINIDWNSPKKFLNVNFFGPAKSLAAFMPPAFTTGITNAFTDESVDIVGGMKWIAGGAQFEGSLHLSDPDTNISDQIFFGFDIEKSSEKLWKRWPADNLAISYWENAGYEALQKVMPPLVSPLLFLESNWIKTEAGIAGLVVRRGWFLAENISLAKYVRPFVFSQDQMELNGIGNFKGAFDHRCLAVEYEAEDVLLENPYLAFKAARIDVNKIKNQNPLYAAHYFDFEKGFNYGTIPLSKATYLEKGTGLLFSDVDAAVIIKGTKVHFSDLTTKCCSQQSKSGLELGGAIDLDFMTPYDRQFTLEIRAKTLKGNLTQVEEVLKGINPAFVLPHIPCEGDVSLVDEGAVLSFFFKPEDFKLEAKVQGMVSNAAIFFKNSAVVQDAKFYFAYEHLKKSLEISNIHGTVLVDKSPQEEQYVLSGDYVRFLDYANNIAEFDVWLGDQSRDIIRIVGKTMPLDHEGRMTFHINHELTHFGDIHPANFHLVVKDLSFVEHFNLGMDIRLNTFFHDLKRFSGFWNVSKSFIKELNNISAASGHMKVDLNYKGASGEFTYNISGNEIAINDYSFRDCHIVGKKSGEFWCLESLLLDQLSASAFIRKKGNDWNFSQLNLRYGDTFKMKLDGDYFPKENHAKARIKSLEIDFGSIHHAGTYIDAFVQACSPHGKMSAIGDLHLEFPKHASGWRAEAILDAALSSWDVKGLHFQDVQNVSCHFISDKGISFRNLNTCIIDPKTRSSRTVLSFEKAYYDLMNGEMLFDNLKFQVAAHHLPWFADALSESFPYMITPAVADAMKNCKLQGTLEGVFQYEFNPPYAALQLSLKDGKYIFLNSEHDLKNFVMEYDPFEFKVVSKYMLGDEFVWMYARSTSPSLSNGELVLTDLSPQQSAAEGYRHALFLNWENDPQFGFSIKNAEGNLYGLDFKMQRDAAEPLSEKAIYLVGRVGLDVRKAKSLFPDEISKKIVEWRIGDGYGLRGKWRLQKEGTQDYANKLHFVGILEGNQFSLKNYQFDSMIAHMEYTPNSVRLQDLAVKDICGKLSSERVDLIKGSDGHWYFSMPRMRIDDFRPSILKLEGFMRPHLRKPMVINELVLESCQGSLGDSNTIIGRGALRFTNRSKKLLQNTIFQIPSEILSRIGLDLAVLTPVIGSIDYTIQNGKIYLTRFKDIYSESKLSKFYLSDASPSTVDFDGNCNVQVRMKQHNLLFKLAELFTVNIGGSLEKPSYSLNKQSHDE